MFKTHSYTPLTPTTLLERSGRVFPDNEAIILPSRSICYGQLLERARKLAELLRQLGVESGDCVGLLSENNEQLIEAHFAIPATGGLIVSLNPWLSSSDIDYQIQFCSCRVLIVSEQNYRRHETLFSSEKLNSSALYILLIVEGGIEKTEATEATVLNYEESILSVQSDTPLDISIKSEMAPIAVNFTSGTTGNPKGVVYTHRAAYLQGLGQVMMLGLDRSSRYFWSLPMFHGNGWFHIWANVAIGSTQILTPFENRTDSAAFSQIIIDYETTHLGGSPRLLRRLLEEKPGHRWKNLTIMTGGAAPPPSLISGMKDAGVQLIHQYGSNETCAAFVVCEIQDGWNQLDSNKQVELRGRQGVAAIHAGTGLRVVDKNMKDVPYDGISLGEVVMAGNTVALEYYKNAEATQKSFKGGWFRSGDIAVVHPDSYIEIKDRMKDLIYMDTDYGWLNISSIEVERVISQCDLVNDVAVIGLLQDKTEEVTTKLVAFVEVADGSHLTIEKIEKYCQESLGIYKCPHYVFSTTLPKTATGKVKKNVLVERAKEMIEELTQSSKGLKPSTRLD